MRTVLVTGASSGIGRATARLFARHGYRVFGTSRRPRPDTDGVRMLELDVRCSASIQRCVATVLDRADRIDLLVNNAGVMHTGFAEETTEAEAEAVFATNFFGVVQVTDAVLPGMRARRSGRIITIGSAAAWVGEPGEGFYAASKAALARYTEALRQEVWHCGIRVSLIEPGAYVTGVLDSATRSPATITDYDGPREKARRALHTGLRGGGEPDDVAAVVLRAARARTPRPRYGVGREAVWIPYATALLPGRIIDRLLRRGFDLPR